MRRGWGALVAFAWALGVLVALAAATPMRTAAAPARALTAMASLGGDAQPTLSEPPSASSPAGGAGAHDVDNDDDSDEDASLAATIAVERPLPRRLAHRPAASASHAPPDGRPLLRPPSPDVG